MTQMLRLSIVALGGILLVGCSDGTGTDGASTSPATEVSSPSATGDTTPLPDLPTACDTLGTAATRAETTKGLELVESTGGAEQAGPEGSTPELTCEWFGGDVTGITVTISTMSPAAATAVTDARDDQGYECSQDLGGRLCMSSEAIPPGQGPDEIDATIETQDMVFARDGVVVTMSTSNADGQVWFSEIVAGIFG